jgi:hypothetical protein
MALGRDVGSLWRYMLLDGSEASPERPLADAAVCHQQRSVRANLADTPPPAALLRPRQPPARHSPPHSSQPALRRGRGPAYGAPPQTEPHWCPSSLCVGSASWSYAYLQPVHPPSAAAHNTQSSQSNPAVPRHIHTPPSTPSNSYSNRCLPIPSALSVPSNHSVRQLRRE